MSHYKTYKETADTPIPWQSKVPLSWEILKLKYVLKEKKNLLNPGLPPGAISFGRVVEKDSELLAADTRNTYQEVLPGEFLINPINLNYDLKSLRTALSKIAVCVSPAYIVLQAKKTICNEFLEYLLYCFDVAHMKTLGAGVRQTITFSDIGNCEAALPSFDEQKRIARFLNFEVPRIDVLIEKKTHFMDLLREKRQAIITQAVTKGLNPNVPMKDSGVEWLGDVPEHWSLKRLRYVVSLNPSIQQSLEDSQEVSFLPMETIGEDGLLNLARTRLVGEVKTGYSYFENGDVAFAKVTPCFENGKGAVMRNLYGSCGFGTTELTVLRPKLLVIAAYLDLVVRCHPFRALGEGAMTGAGGLKRVPDEFTRNFLVALPSIDEQKMIVASVDQELKRNDAILAKTERSIELLKERRSALITAAVTGQIDLREAA